MTNEDPTTTTPVTPPPDPAQAAPPQPSAPPTPPPPSWQPPPADHGRGISLIFGVIILIIGIWYFATRTLGLDLPDFDWGNLWPLILIGIGVLVVYRSIQRNR
jgi:hypothetical protein